MKTLRTIIVSGVFCICLAGLGGVRIRFLSKEIKGKEIQ